ncbi:DUF3847 domain-containing protein [Fusobacterium necrophorum]|uniref:DUF3847 domain-containing protein n=1 Tax=Fusobacterium necrophorum TaxID=859 RepID=UPI00254E28A0|nr:DUF3847 domain-containing protein [Fusobacterium necrophorum]MDK4521939.1 DUF3847 domain-containing protein [Fusobacterium necrophorum]
MDNKTELENVKAEIESKREEKEKYEKKLAQLQNREKQLKEMASLKDRKKRNHRLIERGAILEKITGSSAIKSKDWQKEIQSLESEVGLLNNQFQSIKEEYESINHIKYAVKTVNDDYGIDLSIKMEKAIKRGEKPSVIAQLKKYQEQGENMSREKKNKRLLQK